MSFSTRPVFSLTGRSAEAERFYGFMENKKWDDALDMLEKAPELSCLVCVLSSTCAGQWRLPMFACFGNLLRDSGEVYRTDPGVYRFARKLAVAVDSMQQDRGDKDVDFTMMMFAIRGHWPGILQESINAGVDIKMKGLAEQQFTIPPALRGIWDAWTETVQQP